LKFDPHIHHRRSILLKDYDYSQPGAYFITLVTKSRVTLFGEIIEGQMVLNRYGEIAHGTWIDLPRHYPHVVLDAFVIMPNHIHAIIVLRDNDVGRGGSIQLFNSTPIKTTSDRFRTHAGEETRPYYNATSHGLPEIVRAFKSFSARRINKMRRSTGLTVWQRNYYERIIRNQAELDSIRLYIMDNPRRWAADQENPQSKFDQTVS
jgi:REP element-mobilizing transposase RayT